MMEALIPFFIVFWNRASTHKYTRMCSYCQTFIYVWSRVYTYRSVYIHHTKCIYSLCQSSWKQSWGCFLFRPVFSFFCVFHLLSCIADLLEKQIYKGNVLSKQLVNSLQRLWRRPLPAGTPDAGTPPASSCSRLQLIKFSACCRRKLQSAIIKTEPVTAVAFVRIIQWLKYQFWQECQSDSAPISSVHARGMQAGLLLQMRGW